MFQAQNRRAWVFTILVSIIILRLPSLWIPILDVDEAIFANFAKRLLEGGVPYIDMLDNKPMGIFYLYSAVFAVFGTGNMIAVHAVTMGLVAVTCWFLCRIADLIKGESYSSEGILSALSYAIFTTTYIPKFIATEIEIVMMLPLVIGIYFYILSDKKSSLAFALLGGLFSGVAVIFKYQAGINLIVIGLYWLFTFKGQEDANLHLKRIVYFLFGYLIIPAVMLAHLYKVNALSDFKTWTLSASMSYIVAGFGTIHVIRQFIIKGLTLMLCSYILWIALADILIERIRNNKAPPPPYFNLVILWLILSWIPVAAGGRFYGHYFIQLLPAAVILASFKIVEWIETAQNKKLVTKLIVISYLLPAIGMAGPRYMIDTVYRLTGEDNPKSYKPIAEYIRKNTLPDDFIYAWGFAPSIYCLSGRNSSSRYPYSDQLVGRITGLKNTLENPIDTSSFVVPGSWDLLWIDFDKHPPKYIIDTAEANMHGYAVYKIKNYPVFADYVKANYRLETEINKALIYRRN